jgi:hypothetical protein
MGRRSSSRASSAGPRPAGHLTFDSGAGLRCAFAGRRSSVSRTATDGRALPAIRCRRRAEAGSLLDHEGFFRPFGIASAASRFDAAAYVCFEVLRVDILLLGRQLRDSVYEGQLVPVAARRRPRLRARARQRVTRRAGSGHRAVRLSGENPTLARLRVRGGGLRREAAVAPSTRARIVEVERSLTYRGIQEVGNVFTEHALHEPAEQRRLLLPVWINATDSRM